MAAARAAPPASSRPFPQPGPSPLSPSSVTCLRGIRSPAAGRGHLGPLSGRLAKRWGPHTTGFGEAHNVYLGRTRFGFPCTPTKTTSIFAGAVPLFFALVQVLTTMRNESPAL